MALIVPSSQQRQAAKPLGSLAHCCQIMVPQEKRAEQVLDPEQHANHYKSEKGPDLDKVA